MGDMPEGVNIMFHALSDVQLGDPKPLPTALYLEMIRRIKDAEKRYHELDISCEAINDKPVTTYIEDAYIKQVEAYIMVIDYLEHNHVKDDPEKYHLMVQMLETSVIALELCAKVMKPQTDIDR
jgi:hypothetical protein